MIVLNDLYDYDLKIYQNSDYFKFSLDSILLGEFIKIKKNYKILDICTGNAPIPLILTTKYDDIKIDAVEIQKEIAELARNSVKINELEKVITIYNEDALKFNTRTKYDIFIANPPYFKVTPKSQKNENDFKKIARHEIKITLESIIDLAKKHLKDNGTFYMVHRTERFLETIKELKNKKFGIRKVLFVYTKSNTSAEFFLIESTKSKKDDIKFYSINVKNLNTYKNIFDKYDN